MHMRNDSQVLKIYIDFIASSMNGLDQLCAKENELVKKLNLLNKKRNLEIIREEYQKYSINLMCIWENIYNNPDDFDATIKKADLLENRESLYAITLAQKCVEQFFYRLYSAVQVQMLIYEDDKKQKMYYGDFLTGFIFSYVKLMLKDLFQISLQAMKEHIVEVEDKKKQDFILAYKKFVPDLSFRYSAEELVSDSCIDRIIADLAEQKKKERAHFEEGVKNGSIKVDYASPPTTRKEAKSALEYASCGMLASIIGGSSIMYESLPVISSIDIKSLVTIMVRIDSQVRGANVSSDEALELIETNALYIGLVTGYLFMQSKQFDPDFINNNFMKYGSSPKEVPVKALSFIGFNSNSDEAQKVKNLVDEMKKRFSTGLFRLSTEAVKGLSDRNSVAIEIAYKLGYNAYFRLKKVVPGKSREEDQLKINQIISGNNSSHTASGNKNASDIGRNQANVGTMNKNGIESQQAHKNQSKKYWLDEKGVVKCPGDACPIECSLECPIYAQTMALSKLTQNDFEGAAKLLRIATSIEPSFADAWNNLAACYGQMGDHKNAFSAYQRAYEINPKPNPLYGMVVATKNMGDLGLAKMFTRTYVTKFGSDDRIAALIAEISGNEPGAKTDAGNKQETYAAKEEPAAPETHTLSHSMMETHTLSHTLPNQEPAEKESEKSSIPDRIVPDVSVDDMRRFGKLYLLLLDPDTREAGYAAMEKMENEFPEAAICLGQYYNGTDQGKAKKHIRIAADAGIAEGQWSYSQLLPHSRILDLSDPIDKEYLKYCLAAAEGGCPDAANEMGNICRRSGYYLCLWSGSKSRHMEDGKDQYGGSRDQRRFRTVSCGYIYQ